jgi:hypothetical protein
VELQGRLESLKQQGISVIGVSYDPVPVIADFAARRHIAFPLLSDPESSTIKRYGIFNTTVPETNQQTYGIPFPGTFMLNAQRIVTARFFEPAYQERNTVASILARLGGQLAVPATKFRHRSSRSRHTRPTRRSRPEHIFRWCSTSRRRRGFTSTRRRWSGYKPITLSVEPQTWLLTRAAQYPRRRTYHFKPLNEQVDVYQKPFRIVQDVALDASPEAQAAPQGRHVYDDHRDAQVIRLATIDCAFRLRP